MLFLYAIPLFLDAILLFLQGLFSLPHSCGATGMTARRTASLLLEMAKLVGNLELGIGVT